MNGWYTILTGPETGANLRRRARTLLAAERVVGSLITGSGTASTAVIVGPDGEDEHGCIADKSGLYWWPVAPSVVRSMWKSDPAADLAAMMTEAGIVAHEVAGLVAVIEAVLDTRDGKSAA